MEVIRTRLTLSEGLSSIKYNGIVHCFKHTVKHEGWTSLYKGIVPTWVENHFLLFIFFYFSKKKKNNNKSFRGKSV